MRTEGRPSRIAVASAIRSGAVTPAAAASANHRSNWSVWVGVEIGGSTGREYPPCGPVRSFVAATRIDQHPHRDPGPALPRAPRARRRLDREAAAGVPARLRRRGAQRDDHGRRRQHVHRLRGRRRRLQRRPLPPARRRGDPGAGGAVRPHRFHGRPVRRLRRARRAARRARADRRPDAGGLLQLGRRGRRERGQDRAPRHRAPGGDRVRGGVPRPHDARDDDDVEGAPVQDGNGPVRTGGLPGAVPERVPRPVRERGARRARGDVRVPRRAVPDRRDRVRAAARRGRLRAGAARVRRGAAQDLRPRGNPPGRRRGADRVSAAPAACSRWSTTGSSPT